MTTDAGRHAAPDNTAVRTALWRALHLEVDAPPPVFQDTMALQFVGPDASWRDRADMNPGATILARASIVGRARFVEDVVVDAASRGVRQYVLLGAGLDTFAQRRPEVASQLRVFEVDEPKTQAWKRQRLTELGLDVPEWLHLVPVDFESGASWRVAIEAAGFDATQPAVVASTGVSMYLTREANEATLRELASLAAGSVLVMSFLLRKELMDEEVRPLMEMSERGAAAAGTPFLSFFAPDELVSMALAAGFRSAEHVSAVMLNERYFAERSDGLRMTRGEELIIATT